MKTENPLGKMATAPLSELDLVAVMYTLSSIFSWDSSFVTGTFFAVGFVFFASLYGRFRSYFLFNCNAVHRRLKAYDIKVPIFAGGPLDQLWLQHEVLLIAGLQNIVDRLAFLVKA